MTNIYQANDMFDFDKLHLANPVPYQHGSFFSKLLVGANDDSLYIQTPKCKTKQGIVKTGKKRYTDLLFSNHNENFISFLNTLEENLQQTILKKQSSWFVNNDLDIEDIQNTFISPIRVYKGNNYLVRSNLNQPRTNIENTIPIFNESESVKQMDDITDKSDIICILEILGIKFTQKNFQIEINIKQIMLIENSPVFDNCLIKPTEQSNSSSNNALITESIVNENTINLSNKDNEEQANKEQTNKEQDNEDQANKEQANKEQSNKEQDNKEQDNEEQDNEEQDNEEQDNEGQGLEDGKTKAIPKITVENPFETKNAPNSLEGNTDLEDLLEYEIKIDNSNENGMDLKKPSEIYMNLYLEARNKAKNAKKIALKAYLAAKNIKETYNLEIESDEEEEF